MEIQIDDILNRHRVFHRIAGRFLFKNVATGFHFGHSILNTAFTEFRQLIQGGFAVFLIELGKFQFLFCWRIFSLKDVRSLPARVATFRNCSILSIHHLMTFLSF